MIYGSKVNLLSAPLTVPLNYVGITSEVATVVGSGFESAVIGSLGYRRYTAQGATTYTEMLVKYINPSPPTFDVNGDPTTGFDWPIFDTFVTSNPGKQIQVLLGFPADYLVSTPAVGGTSFGGKSNMTPTDLVTYGKVITAIVRRAKNLHGLTGCRWTIWGEWDTIGDYAGTIVDMVRTAKVTYQAIKAVDPTAIVIAPSLSGALTANALLTAYFLQNDGAGGNGGTWCDGFAMHFYQPYLQDTPLQYEKTIRLLREAAAKGGVFKPVWLEECGILASDPIAGINHARRLFVFAALGVQGYVGFSTDDPVEGYQMSGYQTQWNYAAHALMGSPVMTSCCINPDKTISTVLNGVEYTI